MRPASAAQARSTGTLTDISSQPYITMVVGPELNRQYPLSGSMYFGRDTENDVMVPDPRVSRRHARIRVEGGRATVVDVGSTNGTYVNEVMVTAEQPLHDGDLLRIGRTEYRFHAPGERAMDVPTSAPWDGNGFDEPPLPRAASRVRDMRPPADIVERDDVPWSAIAVVVGGLFIALTVCCIAAVFIASR